MGPSARRRSRPFHAAAVTAAILASSSCLGQATQAPETSIASQELGVDVSAQRARVATQNSEAAYLGFIELTADSIIQATQDPAVARNALTWKANAIPAMQRAMHQADALLSWVDGWILMEQMRAFFDQGLGRDLFGREQPVAVEALTRVTQDIDDQLRAEVSGEDYTRIRGFVEQWVRDHPLDNVLFVRTPPAQFAARALGDAQVGGLSSIGRLEALAMDAQGMAQSYLAFTPKVLLWQAELMAADMLDTARLSPLLEDVDRMAVMQAATRLLEDMPELVANERQAALAGLSTLTGEQLEHLLAMVAVERQAILNELARVVRDERSALAEDVETTLIGVIETAGTEATSVIDHTLWRLGIGLVALLLLMGIGQYLLLRRFVDRRTQRPAPG